jgi:hypothetical protein
MVRLLGEVIRIALPVRVLGVGAEVRRPVDLEQLLVVWQVATEEEATRRTLQDVMTVLTPASVAEGVDPTTADVADGARAAQASPAQ